MGDKKAMLRKAIENTTSVFLRMSKFVTRVVIFCHSISSSSCFIQTLKYSFRYSKTRECAFNPIQDGRMVSERGGVKKGSPYQFFNCNFYNRRK